VRHGIAREGADDDEQRVIVRSSDIEGRLSRPVAAHRGTST